MARVARIRAYKLKRREAIRQSIPYKDYTDEERAGSKLHLAMLLLKNGRHAESRRWLEELVAEFPGTTSAAEAEVLLSRR